jgi:predicted ribosome quality control (RQC) complex YloA/Tae2 family protein
MAHQTELFESFCDDSAILQKTLKDIVQALSTLRSLGRVLDKFQSWEEIFEKLQGVSDDSADTKFFDMTHEITNLREIEDISDELHMIEDILNQQKNAMKMFENVVDTDPKSGALARKLVHSVEARMRTIDQFHRDTRHTYQWVSLLYQINLHLLMSYYRS